MKKRLIGNIIASVFALAAGAVTMYVSMSFLKRPEDLLDWTVLILSGVTTGTIVFFVTWGHFQSDPAAQS